MDLKSLEIRSRKGAANPKVTSTKHKTKKTIQMYITRVWSGMPEESLRLIF